MGEALEDFTGGVTENVDLEKLEKDPEVVKIKKELYERMHKEAERRSLMAASIPVSSLKVI